MTFSMSMKFLFISVITFCVTYISVSLYYHSRLIPTRLHIQKGGPIKRMAGSQDKHVILFWTTYFGHKWLYSPMDFNCEHSNCVLTYDRSRLNEATAVVFHLRDVDPNDLPSTHLLGQKWIAYNRESPEYTEDGRDIMDLMSDHIDWTMSYRRDSDIFAPYGKFTERPELGTYREITPTEFENKTKSVVWFVSNCYTSSKREKFVRQLAQYLDVDIYGSCGSLKCPKGMGHEKCYEMAERKYKYYLSFENSICKDYVTEKLFNIMKYNIIPVVLGGADYGSILPPNSYINALNFSRVEHLAQYLHKLSFDFNSYKSYFNWKDKLQVKSHWAVHVGCDLCKKLNEPAQIENLVRRDLNHWWFNEANCTSWSTN